ncbi:transposase [Desulfarculales bacterium]
MIRFRRFLCSACRAVNRLQPRGYCSRFQAPVEVIRRQSLSNKLARGRWDPDLPRFHPHHWLKGLLRQVSLYLGSSWSDALLGAFD